MLVSGFTAKICGGYQGHYICLLFCCGRFATETFWLLSSYSYFATLMAPTLQCLGWLSFMM